MLVSNAIHCYIIKENMKLNLPHFQLNSPLKTIKITVEISSHNEQENSNNHKSFRFKISI